MIRRVKICTRKYGAEITKSHVRVVSGNAENSAQETGDQNKQNMKFPLNRDHRLWSPVFSIFQVVDFVQNRRQNAFRESGNAVS